jgi:hypothetical protein
MLRTHIYLKLKDMPFENNFFKISNEKYVENFVEEFGIIQENLDQGLFGKTMTHILEILPYLEKNNLFPKWNIDTVLYGNIIPSVLIPKKVSTNSNVATSVTELKRKHMHNYTKGECEYANKLFFKYFDLCPEIYYKLNTYSIKFVGRTLGIHYRGTDKSSEADVISSTSFINTINTILKKDESFRSILLLSDEIHFINEFSTVFTDYNIITTESKKSIDNSPIHFQNNTTMDAINAIVDSVLLSKCDLVIKTSSCLSDWVKIWNPNIEVYNLNKFKFNWFPQSIIPTYEPQKTDI